MSYHVVVRRIKLPTNNRRAVCAVSGKSWTSMKSMSMCFGNSNKKTGV